VCSIVFYSILQNSRNSSIFYVVLFLLSEKVISSDLYTRTLAPCKVASGWLPQVICSIVLVFCLAAATGTVYWALLLEQYTGLCYWKSLLGSATGTVYWALLLEQFTGLCYQPDG
jgi:hypothetical protein